MSSVYQSFQEFMYEYKVVGVAAGWVLGAATSEFISSITDDVIIPSINMTLARTKFRLNDKMTISTGSAIVSFIKWLMVLVIGFLVLEYFFARTIVGVKTEVKSKDTQDFEKSKDGAVLDTILKEDDQLFYGSKVFDAKKESYSVLTR